jgi:hypothetical protein
MTYPPSTTGQTSFVHTAPNINATWGAVNNPGGSPIYAYGFVNKSAICRLSGGVETFPTPPRASGSFFHEYVFNDASHPYAQIVQDGLALEQGQSTALKAQVINFVNYLNGSGNGQGRTAVKKYCYGVTAP